MSLCSVILIKVNITPVTFIIILCIRSNPNYQEMTAQCIWRSPEAVHVLKSTYYVITTEWRGEWLNFTRGRQTRSLIFYRWMFGGVPLAEDKATILRFLNHRTYIAILWSTSSPTHWVNGPLEYTVDLVIFATFQFSRVSREKTNLRI